MLIVDCVLFESGSPTIDCISVSQQRRALGERREFARMRYGRKQKDCHQSNRYTGVDAQAETIAGDCSATDNNNDFLIGRCGGVVYDGPGVKEQIKTLLHDRLFGEGKLKKKEAILLSLEIFSPLFLI